MITALIKNMKKQDIDFCGRILLRKRAAAESVNELPKNFFQTEYSFSLTPMAGMY